MISAKLGSNNTTTNRKICFQKILNRLESISEPEYSVFTSLINRYTGPLKFGYRTNLIGSLPIVSDQEGKLCLLDIDNLETAVLHLLFALNFLFDQLSLIPINFLDENFLSEIVSSPAIIETLDTFNILDHSSRDFDSILAPNKNSFSTLKLPPLLENFSDFREIKASNFDAMSDQSTQNPYHRLQAKNHHYNTLQIHNSHHNLHKKSSSPPLISVVRASSILDGDSNNNGGDDDDDFLLKSGSKMPIINNNKKLNFEPNHHRKHLITTMELYNNDDLNNQSDSDNQCASLVERLESAFKEDSCNLESGAIDVKKMNKNVIINRSSQLATSSVPASSDVMDRLNSRASLSPLNAITKNTATKFATTMCPTNSEFGPNSLASRKTHALSKNSSFSLYSSSYSSSSSSSSSSSLSATSSNLKNDFISLDLIDSSNLSLIGDKMMESHHNLSTSKNFSQRIDQFDSNSSTASSLSMNTFRQPSTSSSLSNYLESSISNGKNISNGNFNANRNDQNHQSNNFNQLPAQSTSSDQKYLLNKKEKQPAVFWKKLMRFSAYQYFNFNDDDSTVGNGSTLIDQSTSGNESSDSSSNMEKSKKNIDTRLLSDDSYQKNDENFLPSSRSLSEDSDFVNEKAISSTEEPKLKIIDLANNYPKRGGYHQSTESDHRNHTDDSKNMTNEGHKIDCDVIANGQKSSKTITCKCWCGDADIVSVRSLNSSSSNLSSPPSSYYLDSDHEIKNNPSTKLWYASSDVESDDDYDIDEVRIKTNKSKILKKSSNHQNGLSVTRLSIDSPIMSDSSEVVHSDVSSLSDQNRTINQSKTPTTSMSPSSSSLQMSSKKKFKRSDFSDSDDSDGDDDVDSIQTQKMSNKLKNKKTKITKKKRSKNDDKNSTSNSSELSHLKDESNLDARHHQSYELNQDSKDHHYKKSHLKNHEDNHKESINIDPMQSRKEDQIERNEKTETALIPSSLAPKIEIEDSKKVIETDEELARRLQQEEYQAARPARRRVAMVAYNRLHEQLSKIKKETLLEMSVDGGVMTSSSQIKTKTEISRVSKPITKRRSSSSSSSSRSLTVKSRKLNNENKMMALKNETESFDNHSLSNIPINGDGKIEKKRVRKSDLYQRKTNIKSIAEFFGAKEVCVNF